jgi:hypothetical protein
MGKTLIPKPLLRSRNTISFMLIIFTFQSIQTINILWFCHRSELPELEADHVTQVSEGVPIAPHAGVGVRWSERVHNPTHRILGSIAQERVTFTA